MKAFSGDIKCFNPVRRVFRISNRYDSRLNRAGFSLVELIIIISIMGFLMATTTMSFNSWQKKSKMQSQMREMLADLADARTRAFTQKKVHGIVFQPNSYVMKSYSSAVEYSNSTNAAANGVPIISKSLAYGITKTNTETSIIDSSILFDITGFTTTATGFTVVVNPVTVSPNLNCLVISAARVNMGKWNATTAKCEFN